MQLNGRFLSYSHRRMGMQVHDCVLGPQIQSLAYLRTVSSLSTTSYLETHLTFSISVFLLFEVL